MRILLVTEFYPPILGGVEIHVANLAREMADRGHEVHVATLKAIDDPLPDPSTSGPVQVHRLRSSAAEWSWLHIDRSRPFHLPVPDPKVRRELRQLVAQIGPDVIHAHGWMAASLSRRGPPLLLTAHDYGWICPKRNLLRPDQSICSGPGPLKCLPCSAEQYGPVKAAMVNVATVVGRRVVRPDETIAVSGAVAEAIAPWSRSAPIVVPNFVPSDLAERPMIPLDGLPEGPFAMFAGAARAHKGIGVLLEAWQDPPCDLVVASLGGASPPSNPAVRFMSFDPVEMPSAWRRASLAIVPSVWADPCPTVALEAMALGVPVVGSAVGGMLDLIDDGVEGRLVAPRDASALRAAVVDLMGDPEGRAAMGAAARRRAASYTVGVVASRLEALYLQAVAKRGGTPVGPAVTVSAAQALRL